MKFEKALEAMKQGKKVKRNSNEKVEYFIRNDTGEITAFFYDRLNPFSRIALYSCELLADDWEICRESNKEENKLSSSVKLLSDFAKSLQFDLGNTAMRTINSYQISDIVSALKTVLDYAKSTIKPAYLKNQEDKEPEMTAEKAKKILGVVRAEAICHGMVFEHCSLEKFVAAIDFALEILKKPAEKEKKVSQLAETSQKILKKRHISHENGKESNTTECNCDNDSILDTIAMTKYHLGFTLTADELARVECMEKENKNNAG